MNDGSIITSVTALQAWSWRGHPAIEARVTTRNGAIGVAQVQAGTSVGQYEVHFIHDGGPRWGGLGVQKAVEIVKNTVAPALTGMHATRQRDVDYRMIELDGTPNKSKLGGNVIAAVSAAVLKAAAASTALPLYQYIGGPNACIMPTPGVLAILGPKRYGGGERGGEKPTYSFYCHGFDTFFDASQACWQVRNAFRQVLQEKLGLNTFRIDRLFIDQEHIVEHDEELWALMKEAIGRSGNEGRIGIQVDCAAGCYYDKETGLYKGLYSREDKTRADMIALYRYMVTNYPFVILEDPLDEDDYEGHAILTRELGIQIVGDDLFTTMPSRVQRGIDLGAANCVLLKVNQVGSITEAFDMVDLAYRNGYAVMPCSSRGEGADIADYAVGLGSGHMREGGLDDATTRLLEIEAELGSRARFLGKKGFKP
ncbi:MAG: phosphopyruvate hydratase [Dehalococcoidia bacterium]|nr:phosphopyruvate hydratase [Dehalococcoidia bacterium]